MKKIKHVRYDLIVSDDGEEHEVGRLDCGHCAHREIDTRLNPCKECIEDVELNDGLYKNYRNIYGYQRPTVSEYELPYSGEEERYD